MLYPLVSRATLRRSLRLMMCENHPPCAISERLTGFQPLFFLHHTQLDRLWWLWQQRQPDKGLTAYGGHKERHSMKMASLEDEIGMRKLAPSIKVAQVMDVEGDFLCYRY